MSFRILVLQRVAVDMDDDGLEPGDGAALVDLAVLETKRSLPFAPFPGLTLRHRGIDTLIDEVVWLCDSSLFICYAEPLWAHTQDAAQGIVSSLIEAGFIPLDDHHREQVH